MQKETRRRSAVFIFHLPYIYIYIYIYIHTHTHTPTHTYTYIHIHTHLVTFPNHNHQLLLLLFPSTVSIPSDWLGKGLLYRVCFLSFHSFLQGVSFPMGRGIVADTCVTCAIASFTAVASLYPTVCRHITKACPPPSPLHAWIGVSTIVCGAFVNLMAAQNWHNPSPY
jgi:hypothetical protein